LWHLSKPPFNLSRNLKQKRIVPSNLLVVVVARKKFPTTTKTKNISPPKSKNDKEVEVLAANSKRV
jgi:hypothetical protein